MSEFSKDSSKQIPNVVVPLAVNAECTQSPSETRVWKITNKNRVRVEYRWQIDGTQQSGNGLLVPGQTVTIQTDTVPESSNRLIVSTSYSDDIVRMSNPTRCGEEVARFIVQGHVYAEDSEPVEGVTVIALDRDLRSMQRLGETTTDERGYYQIEYTADQFQRGERKYADVVIRVMDSFGRYLGESETRFNADFEEEINVTLPQQPPPLSEYEHLLEMLDPVLSNVEIESITDDEIIFLAGETGLSDDQLRAMRDASINESGTDIDASIYYGLASQGISLNLQELLTQSDEILREAIETACDNEIIRKPR